MKLNSVSILNYKNIAEANLSFSPKVNCLIGNNGMGKTNVLDAIYYLSFCKSSTGQTDSSVITHQADMMLLQGHYTRRDVDEDVSMGMQRGKRKVARRGGKEYKRLSQHIGLLPLVMVSPSDWDLIRGAGEERRRLMDMIISQGDQEYLNAIIAYAKAVEQRNAMIKREFRDPILYETVEHQMAQTATFIHAARKRWIEAFEPIFMRYYSAIAGDGETVHLSYKSHLNEATMLEHLAATRERDFIIGYTTRGVHRDDIELLLGEYPMRKTGSQGQCKTYTIALRLAQYEFLKAHTAATPILLLDDIFDKLDAKRVESIIEIVSADRFGQIFITDTNRTHLDEIVRRVSGDFAMFGVENGVCTLINRSTQE
ncbi:MAG: DNA replication and repair protein RecF [Bacteroidales bacterium]|nr:DNA replication and repair protein RecF [Bacteroidales bacterium]